MKNALRSRITENQAYIFVFIAMFFWAFSYLWLNETYAYLSPMAVLLARMLLAVCFLGILSVVLKKLQKIRLKDWKYLVLMAFFEPFLYYIGESYGVKYTSPTTTAVMIATIPIFMPMVGILMIKEKLSLQNFLGIFLSFIGVIILIFNKNFELQLSAKGLLFLMLAIISALGYTVILKKMADIYNSYTIVFYQSLFGLFFFIPLYFSFFENEFIEVQFNTSLVLYIVGLAVFSTSLAYVLFANAVRKLGASKASVFANLIPVFTAFFAFVLGVEFFSLKKVIAILVIISGVFLSQYARKKRSTEKL
jgi:drug/metabolite transporter (DMT)-like permease